MLLDERRRIIPRLSLYRPEKGYDYNFIDQTILEYFTVGGTDLYIHKYLGPKNTSEDEATPVNPHYDSVKETNIQDLLFMENRDRKYDQNIYKIRGIYNVQDNDFNLTQFGLFFDSDIIFIAVHINSSVKTIGRKLMSGDVIELPHLKDEYALNDFSVSLKRFYVIEDVTRASEGFSLTWYPHLYRLKLKQIIDSQEFKDILDLPANEENPENGTLRDIMSTNNYELDINQRIIEQGEIDAQSCGWEVQHYYHLKPNENYMDIIQDKETNGQTPTKLGYVGYLENDLLGGEFAPNGHPFGKGISFPNNPDIGDYYLRTDFMPNRLFRFDGNLWVKMYDNVRMTLSNTDNRRSLKWSFINNTRMTYQDKVASMSIILDENDYIIDTTIKYPINAKYLVLLNDNGEKFYDLTEQIDILFPASDGTTTIKLPIKNNYQDIVGISGQWDIYFYNHAEPERQSLSTALRPKADF